MGKHAKTLRLLEVAYEVVAEQHPMTGRQVYYQLVSRQVIENNRGSIKR
jgi:Type IIB DNA topoisomerase